MALYPILSYFLWLHASLGLGFHTKNIKMCCFFADAEAIETEDLYYIKYISELTQTDAVHAKKNTKGQQ